MFVAKIVFVEELVGAAVDIALGVSSCVVFEFMFEAIETEVCCGRFKFESCNFKT